MNDTKRLKPTTTLILVMLVVVVIAILVARNHYSNINASADPRVVPARLAWQDYNREASTGNFTGVLSVLDSIAGIYAEVPHYRESYEVGVVHVNRSSVFLTVGLHIDSLRITSDLGWMADKTKKGLLDLAEVEITEAIRLYTLWDSLWGELSEEAVKEKLQTDFFTSHESWTPEDQERFLNQRFEEIIEAQWENDRRMSVALTNLGMVEAEREKYQQAAELFKQAVDLWEDNLSAKNNLNRMLGRPLEKRSFIQKLFPKQRD